MFSKDVRKIPLVISLFLILLLVIALSVPAFISGVALMNREFISKRTKITFKGLIGAFVEGITSLYKHF